MLAISIWHWRRWELGFLSDRRAVSLVSPTVPASSLALVLHAAMPRLCPLSLRTYPWAAAVAAACRRAARRPKLRFLRNFYGNFACPSRQSKGKGYRSTGERRQCEGLGSVGFASSSSYCCCCVPRERPEAFFPAACPPHWCMFIAMFMHGVCWNAWCERNFQRHKIFMLRACESLSAHRSLHFLGKCLFLQDAKD
jgi:hypothetical protein